MKKCLLLVFCMLLNSFVIKAQSFSTTMVIKKSDCDTLNGGAKVVPNVTSGTYTYSWSNGVTIDSIRNVVPGIYYVTVTHFTSTGVFIDSLIDTANITLASVAISIFRINNPTCGANNGTILSSITGGSGSYIFYTVNGGVNYGAGVNLPAGLFQVVAYDNLTGCSSDSIPVVLRDTGGYFQLRDTIIQDINCFGDTTGSISIQLTGGIRPYRYSWIGSSSTDSFRINLSKGIYTVNITDSLCPTTPRSFRFEVKGPTDTLKLNASFINDTCYRKVGKIILSASGGNSLYTFYWNDSTAFSGVRDSLNAGSYFIYVLDNKGCFDSIRINIGNSGGPSAYISLLDSSCIDQSNGAIKIKVTSRDRPNHFIWSHDASIDTNYIKNLSAGIYTVTISNNIMCDTVITIQVSNYYTPVLDVIGDTTILQGQSTLLLGLINTTNIDSIFWLPKNDIVELNTNASVSPLNTTIYKIFIRLDNGCYLSDSAIVVVDSIPIEIRIPNIFTPNGDGVNDLFTISTNEAIRNIELHIYDRWGNNVFDSYDKNIHWDGVRKNTNTDCESGVYTYYIYIDAFAKKERIIKEGNITLVR
jgi:gliding motility-associated-like protein